MRRIACWPSASGSSPRRRRRSKRAVAALRERGEKFAMTLTTLAGRPIEAEGQVVGGRAILRFKDVSGVKRELAELLGRFQHQVDDADAMRTLVEALPSPIWARDEAGKLIYVNPAYARAVDAKDPARRSQRGIELFDRAARDRPVPRPRSRADLRRPAAGDRRRRRASSSTCSPSRPAAAAPASASTPPRPTPCAPSSSAWSTPTGARSTISPPASPSSAPTTGSPSTTPRSARSGTSTSASSTRGRPTPRCSTGCATRAGCRSSRTSGKWKAELHEAYRATEAKAHEWHLPDGRTLRVVTTPNPEGGVIYLYDDITEPLDLATALRRADPRAGRDPRQSGGRRRGVRERRAAAAVQSGVRADVEVRPGRARRSVRMSRP